VFVTAKTAEAAAFLSDAFKSRTVSKTYLGIAVGLPVLGEAAAGPSCAPPGSQGDLGPTTKASARPTGGAWLPYGSVPVAEPLGRDPVNRFKVAVVPQGKPARSLVTPVGFNGQVSLVKVAIESGRTHQIRVHLAHLRCVGKPVQSKVCQHIVTRVASAVAHHTRERHAMLVCLRTAWLWFVACAQAPHSWGRAVRVQGLERPLRLGSRGAATPPPRCRVGGSSSAVAGGAVCCGAHEGSAASTRRWVCHCAGPDRGWRPLLAAHPLPAAPRLAGRGGGHPRRAAQLRGAP
jgi:hypothetical protein